MPIRLFALPEHIRDSVIQKFDLLDYVNFYQSSQKSFNAARVVKTRYSLKKRIKMKSGDFYIKHPSIYFSYDNQAMHTNVCFKETYTIDFCKLPLRIGGSDSCVQGTVSEEFCSALIKFFLTTYSTVYNCTFDEITCSPESLLRLIEISKVKDISVPHPLSSAFMGIRTIKNVLELTVSFLSEEQILALDALRFDIESSNITNRGINQMLKELVDGKRIIKECYIETNQPLRGDQILKGIPILTRYKDRRAEVVDFGRNWVYNLRISSDSIEVVEKS